MTRNNGNQGAAQAAPTLAELAGQIKALNEKGDRTALQHAIEVGVLLIQAKPLVPRGQWETWVRETLGMPRVRSSQYMRLAANVRRIAHCKGIAEADRLLRRPSKPRPVQERSKRKPRESGRRLRELYAKRRQGDNSNLMTCRIQIMQVVSVLEGVALDQYGVEDADRDTVTDVHAELSLLAVWLEKSLAVLAEHMDDLQKQDTIRKLREGMKGRTDAEAATMMRLAAKLEQKALSG